MKLGGHATFAPADQATKPTLYCQAGSRALCLQVDEVDIRPIQALVGHTRLNTTALYTQVGTKTMRAVVSPLDRLALTSSD